jgi:hypothetical protein
VQYNSFFQGPWNVLLNLKFNNYINHYKYVSSANTDWNKMLKYMKKMLKNKCVKDGVFEYQLENMDACC